MPIEPQFMGSCYGGIPPDGALPYLCRVKLALALSPLSRPCAAFGV